MASINDTMLFASSESSFLSSSDIRAFVRTNSRMLDDPAFLALSEPFKPLSFAKEMLARHPEETHQILGRGRRSKEETRTTHDSILIVLGSELGTAAMKNPIQYKDPGISLRETNRDTFWTKMC